MADPSVRFASVVDRGVVVVLIGAVALVACGGQEKEQSPKGAPSPSGSVSAPADPGRATGTGLVLRWRMTGGIAGLGGPGTLPEFSLYGDGRAIVKADRGTTSAAREYRLTSTALRRLLNEARSAGLGRPQTIGSEQIADAMILEITLGKARTKVVQPEGMPNVPAVRFWKRLDPDGWAPADQAVPVRPYQAARVAVLAGVSPAAGGQRVSDWPLSRPLGRGEQAAGGICTILTGKDRDTVVKRVATSEPDHRWRSGGTVYSVRLRPALPEERTCRDVAKT